VRQQFELKLCNYTLFSWLGFVGMMAAMLVATLAASGVPKGSLQFVVLFGLCGIGFYGIYRLLQKIAIRPALITVEPDSLTVCYLPAGTIVRIDFAEVVSYRDEFLRDGRELRFRLNSGKKVKLAINSFLGPTGDYQGVVQVVKQAATLYQQRSPAVMAREKSFFEKPFAAVLLVVASALMLFAVGKTLLDHEPLKGSFITAVGTWLSYLGLWLNAHYQQSREG
jgi:hypothetical protein